jgi:diguanylate cyclase (GGDEF)-like protein
MVAEDLRYGLEQMRIHYDGMMIFTTVSAGVTEMQPGDSLAAMLKRADSLLYKAKSEGRNRVVMEELPVHRPKPVLVERLGAARQQSGKTA